MRTAQAQAQEVRPPLGTRTWDAGTWRDGSPARSGSVAYVFLHGLGESARAFDLVAPDLGVGPCVLPDLMGHGESPRDGQGRYGFADHAGDVEALCRGLGRPLVLVGHSMGGAVALGVAARGRLDVRGLALVDVGPEMGHGALGLVLDTARLEGADFADASEYRALLAATRPLAEPRSLDHQAAHDLAPRADGRLARKRDPRVLDAVASLADEGTGLKMWSAIGAVECPLLVVRGEHSMALPAEVARRMADNAVDGTLRTVRGAGHGVMADNSTGFAEAVRPWLAALDR